MTQDQELRYNPEVERVYRTDQVEVTWQPGLCIHFGACVRGSTAAFDPRRRPWVDPTAETPERLEEIVLHCPSGALHVNWLDGRPSGEPSGPAAIMPQRDGPLYVRGLLEILDRNGRLVRRDTRMALCRCGQSSNKPFCDDSHYDTGFKSEDPAFAAEGEDPS
jgi:uncharacterized Fe-S cluster protein YjdI/CDGSH-type Zn-finger protein